MSNNMKRALDNIEFESSSMKHIRRTVTSLLDLPNEMLFFIYHYLSTTDILRAFHTPSNCELRLHRLSYDHFKNIKLDGLTNEEFVYISTLFSDHEYPLRPQSLTLSNKHVTCLINSYFTSITDNVIQSIFIHLTSLTLIKCSTENLHSLNKYITHLTQLKYLHITIQKPDMDIDINHLKTCNRLVNEFLFEENLVSIHTIHYEIYHGLSLTYALKRHINLRHVHLVLATVDDLYILLNGLIPNVQILIIELFQTKISSTHLCENPSSIYSHLTQFTLLESSTEFKIDNIKSILGYMTNLVVLTLSIHDTYDPLFCHGPIMESILTEYLPYLRQFYYTMTHQMTGDLLIQDFHRWPMNVIFYGMEHSKWIHIYSLPWPASKNDQRRLPIVRIGSKLPVSSEAKRYEYRRYAVITEGYDFSPLNTEFRYSYKMLTSLSIDIKLPLRIHKLILSRELATLTMNSIVQPSIDHLIAERSLKNDKEMLALAHQFPNVKYLELNLPDNKSSFMNCLNILSNRYDIHKKNNCLWSKLIHVSTQLFSTHRELIFNDKQLYDWFIRYANLKDDKNIFKTYGYPSTLSIWY
ncbi:unnamed protein product [Adineta steineri]|uniref:F-box domain-containing protein n=1 Tax=Adineta steineri TaxID=433720 RepID=A0A819SGT2_9BILA|nr:unnamed protein product [Adineta steineri]CAF4062741.1 unnamed protein product [Adineta steineri]